MTIDPHIIRQKNLSYMFGGRNPAKSSANQTPLRGGIQYGLRQTNLEFSSNFHNLDIHRAPHDGTLVYWSNSVLIIFYPVTPVYNPKTV